METKPRLLFRTIHGSHLYGLSHEGSDQDWYEVWDTLGSRRARQTIANGQDTLRISLSEWMKQCDAGVPQALEAMFAPTNAATLDLLGDFRRGYRANTAHAVATYRRTAKAFALAGDPKRARHARRLEFDLGSILERGRFDPSAFGRTPLALGELYGIPARAI